MSNNYERIHGRVTQEGLKFQMSELNSTKNLQNIFGPRIEELTKKLDFLMK
jgi:hypothetical protein